MSDRKTIAVLGGTGKEGGGLALRWAHVGHDVIIGSRTAERAEEGAAAMRETLGAGANVRGLANPDAAAAADIVVLAVPFAAQQATLREVARALVGKILIDVTVPLVPPKVFQVQLPDGGSAVEAAQALLGEEVRVVSAFQNISAHHLTKLDEEVECDVLVCADDPAAAEEVRPCPGDRPYGLERRAPVQFGGRRRLDQRADRAQPPLQSAGFRHSAHGVAAPGVRGAT